MLPTEKLKNLKKLKNLLRKPPQPPRKRMLLIKNKQNLIKNSEMRKMLPKSKN